MVRLESPLAVTLSVNGATGTESPTGQFNISDAASPTWIAGVTLNSGFAGGQRATWRVSAARPAGAGATTISLYAYWRNAAGAQVGSRVDSDDLVLTMTAQQVEVELPVAPVGAVGARLGIDFRNVGTNRKFVVSSAEIIGWATADEILAAALSRPLRREAVDVATAAAPVIVSGTPGLLAGTITYLCPSLAAAQAVDALYRAAAAPITLTDAGELAGLRHVAIGSLRLAAERAVPGHPSRWTVQADIREQP